MTRNIYNVSPCNDLPQKKRVSAVSFQMGASSLHQMSVGFTVYDSVQLNERAYIIAFICCPFS